MILSYTSNSTKLYELILPGDPAVTANAFCELSKAIGRGESLSAAIDDLCDTIMATR